MTKKSLINKTIKLIGCDTARISSPCKKHFMIIGYNKNTATDKNCGQWYKNDKPFDFDYVAEKTIASSSTLVGLWEDIKYYHSLPKKWPKSKAKISKLINKILSHTKRKEKKDEKGNKSKRLS